MNRTILLASADGAYVARILPQLVERGFHVVGPVASAGMALAIAATTPVRIALVGDRLSGARHGRELARILRRTWGIPSVLVRGPEAAAPAA